MKTGRVIVGVCIVALLLVSCANTSSRRDLIQNDPVFAEGYQVGLEMAEKDRVELDCSDPWLGTKSARKVRSYEPRWEKEQKPEAFVSGFRYGYRKAYRDNIETMCD